MEKVLKYENGQLIFIVFSSRKCQNNLQQHWISRFTDISIWLAKIPHSSIGGFGFWDYLWCWNPAAVVNRDLNRISQRGGSGEQAQSQSSVPGFCSLTANGRFEKRQSTVKKKNLTKTLSSCSSRTTIFSNIQRIATKHVQIYKFLLIHIWCSCRHSHKW